MNRAETLLAAIAMAAISTSSAAHADDAQIARGGYLVELGGCSHCHTPGYLLGKPGARHAFPDCRSCALGLGSLRWRAPAPASAESYPT